MRSRILQARRGLAVVAIAAAVPAAAVAGKRVVSGQQSLQIKASLRPDRAGARSTLRLRTDYEGPAAGQRPPYNIKMITVVLPRGLGLHLAAAPSCKRSQIDAAHGDLSKCPARSVVGHGSVVVNAAPTIPTPITGTVTIYNAQNDLGQGQPKGTRNLLFFARTSIGANATLAFRVSRLRGGRVKLSTQQPKPSHPGLAPGDFSLQKVDITITGSRGERRPFVTNPPTCAGGWPFTMTISNYFGQPSVTAADRVRCRR